jgi:hypothetical protein
LPSLTQKQEEREEVLQEKSTDKKVQVELEWVQTDLQSGKKVELLLVQEMIETSLLV